VSGLSICMKYCGLCSIGDQITTEILNPPGNRPASAYGGWGRECGLRRRDRKKKRVSVSILFKLAVPTFRMDDMSPPPGQVPGLVARAAAGDRGAVVELLARYRGRLRRMVALRLDPRLQGRVDASDVIQEGYLDAMRRLDEFIRDPSVPFYIWLRFLVGQRVQEQHRRHLGTPGRDVGREVSIYRGAMPGASTGALAARLLGKLTSPSQAAVRAERKIRLQESLNRLDPLDREILVLRHYEQMTNGDAAAALGLEKSAASKRYTRALERLKEIMASLPGATSEEGS
jgi:RNA polymerase sigma-70 factor, ECF subfamily